MKVAPKPDSQVLELDGLVAHWVSNINGGNSGFVEVTVFSIGLTAVPVEELRSSHKVIFSSSSFYLFVISFHAPSFLHLISERMTSGSSKEENFSFLILKVIRLLPVSGTAFHN